jgi:arginine deiminase
MGAFGAWSEVGKLRTVLLHQPGDEHRRTIPWNRDALLFDDLLDIEEARPQHKQFSQTLSSHGVEVLFLSDLLKDVCRDPSVRGEVFREVLEGIAVPEDPGLQPYDLISGFPRTWRDDAAAGWEPLPNLYFMRDPAFAVPGAIVISHPFWPARKRESLLVAAVLKRHPRLEGAVIYEGILDDPEARIEGGDVLVADAHNVIVGVGERTNDAGAAHLARFLFENTTVQRLFKLHIPAKREFMHLDTIMTFVDRGQVLTMPYLWERPEVYSRIAARSKQQCQKLAFAYHGPDPESFARSTWLEVWTRDGLEKRYDDEMRGLEEYGVIEAGRTITVAGSPEMYSTSEDHAVEALREQWTDAANTLAVKPGQVVSYSCNDRTIRALENGGIEVLAIQGSELVHGRGGARCMSMPLLRDPI